MSIELITVKMIYYTTEMTTKSKDSVKVSVV